MKRDEIQEIVSGVYPDPDGGAALSVPTRSVVIRDSLAGMEADLVTSLGLKGTYAVVSDVNTRTALGLRVERALESAGKVLSVVFSGRPHADIETVTKLETAASEADVLIAVGSGTINDLCKFTAARTGRPYAVFCTAPSMNGYTSVNASITEGGMKKTLPAKGAEGVFVDLTVFAGAPPRLIRAGLGDSVCRPTVQADWLLAHLLLGQPYREAPFAILAPHEAELFASADALLKGDLRAMELLARTLILSGFGMTICGGSQPASQGEHLISHYMDMFGSADWPESFHGEQIGVTALTMAELQDRALGMESPMVSPSTDTEADFKARYGGQLGALCWAEFVKKRLTPEAAEEINRKLETGWNEIKSKIGKVARPAAELRDALERAGAPTEPEQLGWPRDFYAKAVAGAREIRNRYTFLDFAADCGII